MTPPATKLERRIDRSRALYDRALRSLAGGVGSMARGTAAGYAPHPLYMERGEGSRVWDVDGNEYVDYLLALGPLILGHRPPAVTRAVVDVLERRGSMLGTNHPLEPELAERVLRAVPGAELVRFSNSGTEAVMMALRLARAFTGKRCVVRFEGHFHGWADTIQWSVRPAIPAAGLEHAPRPLPAVPGIPEELADTLLVLPWNRPEVLERTVRERRHEIAAVITEPLMANNGCVEPQPGFLGTVREITAAHGVLLIFDEVITGFRLALGGAQEHYGVRADLATFAKAMGAGYPISALAGRRDVMELVARNEVPYLGTYNTSSLVVAAAIAALDELARPGTYERLFALGERLANGLRDEFRRAGIPALVQGLGPVFQLWFTDTPATTYREAIARAKPAFYAAFQQAMLRRGVLFHPSQQEHLFLSTAHTDEDIDRTLDAARGAVAEIRDRFA
jgi:glutamate-1-semialdehyde 2,1-aminomutase